MKLIKGDQFQIKNTYKSHINFRTLKCVKIQNQIKNTKNVSYHSTKRCDITFIQMGNPTDVTHFSSIPYY